MISIITILVVSYLIGSIPTSIIVSRFTKGIDIRQHGSGNAGGTNAFRVLGWKAGLFVTLFDMLKGVAVVLWVVAYFEYNGFDQLPAINIIVLKLLAGCAAVVGHIYTVFADFKGGKGVSTAAGMMIGIAPVSMLLVIGVFFVTMLSSRYVSLASMLAALSFPVIIAIRKFFFGLGNGLDYYVTFFGDHHRIHDSLDISLMIFGAAVAIAIIYTHRANISRLRLGTENQVKLFSNKK
ncbi:MAG: glycerol-3-phosphate 1-O-acyltransferase PlsY [Chloroherpetonaceae bacterium]|nr:glycerol-3-phosphate 1-O-acyltransferase PlsY [Chloroherpetonaceae bacterium]